MEEWEPQRRGGEDGERGDGEDGVQMLAVRGAVSRSGWGGGGAGFDARGWEFKLLDVAGQELKGFGEGKFDGEEAAMTYQARQRSRLYEIQQLKASLEQTEVRGYAEELEHEDLGSNAVTIASVSKAQLAEQQRALDEERERVRVEQRRLHRRRQDILSRQEAEAMAAVATERAALAHERLEVEEERLAKDRTRAVYTRTLSLSLSHTHTHTYTHTHTHTHNLCIDSRQEPS